VKIVAPTPSYTFNNIVVNVPNVRKPVPLFIMFRALGVLSDKQIITMCLLDLEKYDNMIELFVPSVHDAGAIMSQRDALNYIAILTKGKTINHALEILADYFLPHVGEVAYIQKAYYLGYIVKRLLNVSIGVEVPTDRDSFRYKRIELAGSLLYDLFKEYLQTNRLADSKGNPKRDIPMESIQRFYSAPGKKVNLIIPITDSLAKSSYDKFVVLMNESDIYKKVKC
jgi:DNA-directed RNA polymerase II subunit RPB2